MSKQPRARRPPRAWIGPIRPVDPAELLGPRGLTEELLAEPEDSPEIAADGSQQGFAAAPAESAEDAFHRSLMSEQRLSRIESVIAARLSSVTVVLDRLLDPHNVAAILRTAEGMGIGSASIVAHADGDPTTHRRVTRDADKWLSLTLQPTGAAAALALRAQGFAVYAGHLGEDSLLVQDLPVDRPIALLFGNEHEGPSAETISACTGSFRIPMAGFTQSFNVSVAAAIALFGVAQRRRAHLGAPGDLDLAARARLRSRFLRLGAKLARRIRNLPKALATAQGAAQTDPEQNE